MVRGVNLGWHARDFGHMLPGFLDLFLQPCQRLVRVRARVIKPSGWGQNESKRLVSSRILERLPSTITQLALNFKGIATAQAECKSKGLLKQFQYDFSKILQSVPNLTHLQLVDANVPGDALRHINMEKLVELDLTGCYLLTKQDMIKFFKKGGDKANLRVLSLNELPNGIITDTVLSALLQGRGGAHNLRVLELRHIILLGKTITDAGMRLIAQYCSALHGINLAGWVNITDTSVEELATANTQLRWIACCEQGPRSGGITRELIGGLESRGIIYSAL
ncbi:hypothetical protein YB2330_003509 [Saitoella coloradoensis]